ncbi:peptidase C39 family protein [Luteococcus sp. H138]|uniref:peptidase C39 family protein n=1 Tax=unclassified Luteococcus TaxID=2639923 RepID=UPI00313E7447
MADQTAPVLPSFTRRSLISVAPVALLGTGLLAPEAQAAATRNARITRWSGSGYKAGTHWGTKVSSKGLYLSSARGSRSYRDPHTGRTLSQGVATWTSPVVATQLAAKEIIPSWNASTQEGSAVRIQLRARSSSGRWSGWFTLGLWGSASASAIAPTRTSVNGQSDSVARVATDTLVAQSGVTFSHYQARLELLRTTGTTAMPIVSQFCVLCSTGKQTSTPVSPVGVARGRALTVPAYSQMLHMGHYPAWNGGGEAWCSATCLAMILDYWKAGASPAETAWVRPRPHTDPQVEQVVRGVWDAGYRGTGNWPFNVAYASARGLQGFVTRLRSLNEAERFIRAGIPLVVSTSFSRSQLTGAGFGTNGHLMVIRGFDESGNVLVNDPASGMKASNRLVPRTYNRAQFESAWGRTGGLTYVIHPKGMALPSRPRGLPVW